VVPWVPTSELTQLLPLGGASILMIYLLRVWVAERSMWRRERTELLEEHRKALADRDAECTAHLNYWRGRVKELEADVERLEQQRRRTFGGD
jgi:hypothetical protein